MVYLLICISLYHVLTISDKVVSAHSMRPSMLSPLIVSSLPALMAQQGKLEAGAKAPSKKYRHGQPIPQFLRQSLLFYPQSLELTPVSEATLRLDALWIKEHADIRIVIVGYCDPLGSEVCTHDLAEQRGARVKETLLKYGVDTSQIVRVKGWEDADPACRATTASCQEMNRRARIFVAGFARASGGLQSTRVDERC